jgi:hypothetical protein
LQGALSALALLLASQSAPAAPFVFAGNPATNDVSVLTFGADGSVVGVPGSPSLTSPGTAPRGLTMSADGRFLFLADSGSNQVASFSVGADGKLTQVGGSPAPSERGPAATAITPARAERSLRLRRLGLERRHSRSQAGRGRQAHGGRPLGADRYEPLERGGVA